MNLEEGDTELTVRYEQQGVLSETKYSVADLQALLEASYARRGAAGDRSPDSFEEKLRAVGQDMERKNAKSIRIDASGETYTARYFQRGQGSVRAFYLPDMFKGLTEQSKRRRREDGAS